MKYSCKIRRRMPARNLLINFFLATFLSAESAQANDCHLSSLYRPEPNRHVQLNGEIVARILDTSYLVLEVNGLEARRESVSQPDAGAPDFLFDLGNGSLAVLGVESSFLFDIDFSDSDIATIDRINLPRRFNENCGFWARFWGTCTQSRARHSQILGGVVVSGWSDNEEFGTEVFIEASASPVPISLPDGTDLRYIGEDFDRSVIFQSVIGERYRLFEGRFTKCEPLVRE